VTIEITEEVNGVGGRIGGRIGKIGRIDGAIETRVASRDAGI